MAEAQEETSPLVASKNPTITLQQLHQAAKTCCGSLGGCSCINHTGFAGSVDSDTGGNNLILYSFFYYRSIYMYNILVAYWVVNIHFTCKFYS